MELLIEAIGFGIAAGAVIALGAVGFSVQFGMSNVLNITYGSLMTLGADMGIRPHGLQALFGLRLEKGHVIIGMDTELDTTPRRLGMDWAVRMEKPRFIGRGSLERTAKLPDGVFVPTVAEKAARGEKAATSAALNSCAAMIQTCAARACLRTFASPSWTIRKTSICSSGARRIPVSTSRSTWKPGRSYWSVMSPWPTLARH